MNIKSPSSRRAWIEITSRRMQGHRKESPSSRRAWIEIAYDLSVSAFLSVALLAEGVDRNLIDAQIFGPFYRRPPRGGRG